MSEPRLCRLSTCGKPLVRKPGENTQNWNARLFCDQQCSRLSPNRRTPPKGSGAFSGEGFGKSNDVVPYPRKAAGD